MDLEIIPATQADIPVLMNIRFSAFASTPMDLAISGPDKPENQETSGANLSAEMKTDPSLHVVKVVDNASYPPTTVGFCQLYLPDPSLHRETSNPQKLLAKAGSWCTDPAYRDQVRRALLPVVERRQRIIGYRTCGFIRNMAVLPEYQHRGIGEMMVEYATGHLDAMGLDCYLEASEASEFLYRRHGFDVADVHEMEWYGEVFRFPAMWRRAWP